MTAKSGLMILALAASTITVASARSWDIYIAGPARAANVSLPAGHYSVKVNGATATFRDKDSFKVYTAPVKIDNAAKKYPETALLSRKEGDTEVIRAIELGGTTEEVEFGE